MTAAPRETVRIESGSRHDALDLLRRLPGRHAYLVQLGDRRWHVCVTADGSTDEMVPELLRTAAEWAAERHVAAVLRVGDDAYELQG